MKKFLLTIGFLFALATVGNAQSQCVDVEEIDGSPKAPCIRELKVTNGTLNCPTINRCVLTISGGGGTPGGSNKQIQYNNSSNFGGATGFEYQSGASPNVLITAQGATYVPLQLKLASAHSTAGFELRDSGGSLLSSFTSSGGYTVSGDSTISLTGSSTGFPRKLSLANVGSGTAFRQEYESEGTSIMVREGGKFQISGRYGIKLVGSSNSTFAPSFETGASTDPAVFIENGNTTAIPLRVNAISSTSTNLFEVQSNASNVFHVSSTGATLTSGTVTLTGNISRSAWTTSGIRYSSIPATLTDTTSSGTVAAAYTNNYGGNTIAATNVTTFSDYFTTFITQPTAGTNVTFTRRWALGLSGAAQVNRDSLGTTSTDGLVLQNSTAAAAGAQQYSPRLRLTGQGWKTNATAASQTVDWIIENQPVQGAAAPTSTFRVASQINGGGYSSNLQITSGNGFTIGNTSTQAVAINVLGTGNLSNGYTQINNLNNNNTFALVAPAGGPWAMEMGSGYGVKGRIGLIASTTDALEIGSGMSGTSPFSVTKSYLKFDTSNVRLQTDTPFVIGGSGSIGTSGTNVLAIFNGTAPSSSPADEFQLYSADSAAGDANAFARNEAGEVNRLTGLSARVSTQFDKTSDTTLANVTGLSRNVEAGRTYAFTAVLYTTSNVAGGVKAAIGGTATATSIIYQAEVLDGSTLATMGTARATSLGTTVGDVTAVTAARITITGTIVVNAAGTLVPQFAQNASNGSASSVLVNSSFQLIPIS